MHIIKSAGIVIIIFALCIGMASGEVIPDKVLVNVNPEWVVAGSSNTSTISIILNTSGPSGQLLLRASCDPILGDITPESQVCNVNGSCSFTFKPGTKRGETKIIIKNSSGAVLNDSTIIKIDHNIPKYYDKIIYPESSSVNSTVDIVVRLKDEYGNIVDNKSPFWNIYEYVSFISTEPGSFVDNGMYTSKITKSVDANGNVTVTYKMPEKAGINSINIKAGETVINNNTWIFIKGTPGEPKRIDGILYRNEKGVFYLGNTTIAKEGVLRLVISLYDEFDNKVPNRTFYWWTKLSGSNVVFEENEFITNSYGDLYLDYGPVNAVVDIDHYAGMKKYEAMWSNQTHFISPGAANFLLNADDQTIKSRDYNSSSYATISIRLIDAFGNPVNDTSDKKAVFQILDFRNDTILDFEPCLATDPTINASSNDCYKKNNGLDIAVINGFAKIYFIPGIFNKSGNKYASGWAQIEAKWNGTSHWIIVEFKNYPHLRVTTEAPEECVPPGERVTIKINIIADGDEMRKPVDIVLLEDRSNTMLYGPTFNTGIGRAQDRMWSAVDASNVFLKCMTESKPDEGYDLIAIASYGDKGVPKLNKDTTKNRKLLKYVGDDNSEKDNYLVYYYRGNMIDNYSYFSLHHQSDFIELKDENLIILNDTLQNLTPYNDREDVDESKPENNPAAPLRLGLYESILHLQKGENEFKFIVGLMDTQWTWYGDPLASGPLMSDPFGQATAGTSQWYPFNGMSCTANDCYGASAGGNWSPANGRNNWQNMSIFANDTGIRIFMVYYNGKEPSVEFKDIQTLCNATKGAAYYAKTPEELVKHLINISSQITKIAAVGVQTKTNFNKVIDIQTGEAIYGPGNFSYIYEIGNSTYISYSIFNTTSRVQENKSYTINQTQEWKSGFLTFNIGNMTSGDRWSAQIVLNATRPGMYKILGNDSSITYWGDIIGKNVTILMPDTFICINETAERQSARTNIIEITGENATYYNASEMLKTTWKLNYTGNDSVRQMLYYQYKYIPDINCSESYPDMSWADVSWGAEWIFYDSIYIKEGSGPITLKDYSSDLHTQYKSGLIRIMIHAYEEPLGGPSDIAIVGPECIEPLKGKILIQ